MIAKLDDDGGIEGFYVESPSPATGSPADLRAKAEKWLRQFDDGMGNNQPDAEQLVRDLLAALASQAGRTPHEEVAKALEAYVVWHGGIHDDECPGDDTCDCSGKWMNDGANAACKILRGEAGRTPPSEQDAFPAWLCAECDRWWLAERDVCECGEPVKRAEVRYLPAPPALPSTPERTKEQDARVVEGQPRRIAPIGSTAVGNELRDGVTNT